MGQYGGVVLVCAEECDVSISAAGDVKGVRVHEAGMAMVSLGVMSGSTCSVTGNGFLNDLNGYLNKAFQRLAKA